MTKCVVATALVISIGSITFARAESVDSSLGRHLAETVCSACHQTDAASTLPSPNPDAPSFVDISHMPSMTDLAIKVFLRSPHPSMPNFILSSEEIDSLTAYIRSLAQE
ncbi:MAG TPA: c-type cytochrome [Methylocella sp.]|nr:c-type cytochrome [Methylocella sp.]